MKETAYGFIPFYRDEHGLKVFLIHQYGSGGDMLWTFPKGRGEKGESGIQTAIRELKEETNLEISSYDERKSVGRSYSFERKGAQVDKTSTYFIGFVKNPNFIIQPEEVKEAGWFLIPDAEKQLTFPNYKKLLKDALAILDK
jgi:bis(5'-nucleosidyl)-tetraphosphatase